MAPILNAMSVLIVQIIKSEGEACKEECTVRSSNVRSKRKLEIIDGNVERGNSFIFKSKGAALLLRCYIGTIYVGSGEREFSFRPLSQEVKTPRFTRLKVFIGRVCGECMKTLDARVSSHL